MSGGILGASSNEGKVDVALGMSPVAESNASAAERGGIDAFAGSSGDDPEAAGSAWSKAWTATSAERGKAVFGRLGASGRGVAGGSKVSGVSVGTGGSKVVRGRAGGDVAAEGEAA